MLLAGYTSCRRYYQGWTHRRVSQLSVRTPALSGWFPVVTTVPKESQPPALKRPSSEPPAYFMASSPASLIPFADYHGVSNLRSA